MDRRESGFRGLPTLVEGSSTRRDYLGQRLRFLEQLASKTLAVDFPYPRYRHTAEVRQDVRFESPEVVVVGVFSQRPITDLSCALALQPVRGVEVEQHAEPIVA